MKNKTIGFLRLVLVSLLSLAAGPALAQDDSSEGGFEELIRLGRGVKARARRRPIRNAREHPPSLAAREQHPENRRGCESGRVRVWVWVRLEYPEEGGCMGMKRLAGKSILLTGAAAGIGRATALLAAREGARITIVDVALAGAEETAAQIQAAGGEAIALTCDVTQSDQVQAAIAATVDAFGRLDGAVNNAGSVASGTLRRSAPRWRKRIGSIRWM